MFAKVLIGLGVAVIAVALKRELPAMKRELNILRM